MHIPSLIEQKREGGKLPTDAIRAIIAGFTTGEVPDYQMSALAMAIYFRGMDGEETAALTDAMLNSGTRLHWADDAPPRVDKHSTGGIGDKTSLVLAPLLACDGLWVPMISGRGLGITGGTLDKLESIPGFSTQLSEEHIYQVIADCGFAMVGQTPGLCPADKKLYALRDVTGTVPSIPLITASIMSKKLAEGLNRLVLDVKFGSGAFMKTREQAVALGESMVTVGTAMGVQISVQINEMNQPTGASAGNALEVAECVRCLQGQGPADLENIVLDLATAVSNSDRESLAKRLRDGSAWAKFQRMVELQGGDVASLERIEQVHRAEIVRELRADRSGTITQMDAGTVGRAVLELGAGRSKASDPVDFGVGCDQIAKVGTAIHAGDTLIRVHARTEAAAERAFAQLREGITIA